MEQAPTSSRSSGTGLVMPLVTVRYWAGARAAAGRAEDRVSGDSVAQVLAAVLDVHVDNPRFAQVVAVSALLLGDTPLGSRDLAAVAVSSGDVIEVLPPFAGG